MMILETLRLAIRALLRNKTRSFLTALGIIIGVGAVIAMVSIGEGAKARVEQAFASMGSNVLVVVSGSSRTGGMMGGAGSMPTLTWDDLRAIQTELTSVRYASPGLRINAQIVADESNWSTQIMGIEPEYLDIRAWKLGRGERFTASDLDASAKVVILGQTVVDNLYGEAADPVGQVVRIRSMPFTVIGVTEKKGQSPMGQDYDDTAFVPVTTFRTRLQGGLQSVLNGPIFVGATSSSALTKAEKDITRLLRDRHNIQPGQEDDFSIRNLTEMASAQQEGTKTLSTLLASIAAVSLLVGGIGIMNIMLVSVTERTREIGIRMAVGARPRSILAQFLVEALTLSMIGGLIGVGLGVGAAAWLADQFGWPILIQPGIVALSLGFSALVGVGFGLYPAHKASRLDPIEALRYE